MKRIFLILGLVVGAGLIALGFWLKTPAPASFDRQAALDTANDYEVRIIRDKYGVPHIYGERDADVAFGLAYAHAEDDIVNMQDGRRFARGQMGLATGTDGAITDYLVAAMQARKFAEEKYQTDLSDDTRAALAGYAAGINLFCAEQKDRCEPGFAPVTPIDIVSSYVSRTPFFYGFDGYLTKLFEGDVAMLNATEATREAYLGTDHSITPGSNAIAVAPSRSTDGHTRLMVNSHQPFIGPVAWYEARVKSEEGWDMIGGLFPGTPLISHGASPDLGWAITVNKPDLVDFYQLEVNDDKSPTQYLLDGQWRDFEMETITIRVKFWGPFSFPSRQTLRWSVHGPVFDTPNGFVAVAFAGNGNVRAVEQWFRMNKSKTHADWQNAMAVQGIPSFNFVYGDAAGNIGYYYNALVPVRSADWDWSQMAPGNRSDLVWQGTHAFGAATPTVTNPVSGYVINSNHSPFESTGAPDKPDRSDFPAHYGISDLPTNRGLRAQTLYGGDNEISAEEFLRYKMDTRFDPASGIMTHLRALAADPAINSNPDFADALNLFAGWDGYVHAEDRTAGLAIRATQLAHGIEMRGDGAELPDPAQALSQAMEEYMEGFGRLDPQWQEVNRHKRGDVDIPVNGAPDVLRAIYSIDNPKDGPLSAIAGDSYILYADWDETGKATIQTIHQYGSATLNETSEHYSDQAQLFADEGFRTPPLTLEGVLAEATRDYVVGGDSVAER